MKSLRFLSPTITPTLAWLTPTLAWLTRGPCSRG
jgi:hypothetical protein